MVIFSIPLLFPFPTSYIPCSYATESHGSDFFLIYLCYLFYFWLCWVVVAAGRLSLAVASGGYSSLQCVGFSLWWLLLLWSMGSRLTGSVVVACGL